MEEKIEEKIEEKKEEDERENEIIEQRQQKIKNSILEMAQI